MNRGAIIARRLGADVLIADEPTRIDLVWDALRSADGEEARIVLTTSIACVDTDADRSMLADRFLDHDSGSLTAARLASALAQAAAPAVCKAMSALQTRGVDDELNRDALVAIVGPAVRVAAFASGLAVCAPGPLQLAWPSRERERQADDLREKLDSLSKIDQARAQSISEVTRVLTEASDDAGRVERSVAALHLADPLDLLRATALVDPAWSASTPALWVAAGTRVLRITPTRANINLKEALELGNALGPLRSVSPSCIDGEDVLLIGARDGVHAVSVSDSPQTLRTFQHRVGSEFGYNAACFLSADRTMLATHSQAGIVSWRWDDAVATPYATRVDGAARAVIAVDDRSVVLLVGGRLMSFDGTLLSPFAGNLPLASFELCRADGTRFRRLLREDQISNNAMRYVRSSEVEDEIVIAGIPRSVRALAAGGLEMCDAAGRMLLSIGTPAIAAHSVATRPGFVAAISADRTRLSLIDLGRPDGIATELNIAAAVGSRISDICFA